LRAEDAAKSYDLQYQNDFLNYKTKDNKIDIKRVIRENLPKIMLEKMYLFQIQGIEFGLQKYGRFLLGDEMGVGKTA
jgi:hypothetical protein